MKEKELVEKGKSLVGELSQVCRELSDDQIRALFGDGAIEELLTAILDPKTVAEYPTYADFFLANKHRAEFMALLRLAIQRSYSFEGKSKTGVAGYASPYHIQWFEDGVMLLEGVERFAGRIALYREGEIKYAVAARDVDDGEEMGPDDFLFVSPEDGKVGVNIPRRSELDVPVEKLQSLLDSNIGDESQYQELFAEYPWVFGLQYKSIQRHEALDDENIPDFTGVRVNDSCRDILEIKPPTMSVFRADGEFTADFNTAWNQTERYLNFARQEANYLRSKGLRYDNPKAVLVCGYNLDKADKKKIRVKERMNPAIQVMTFNDVLVFMKETIGFAKRLARDTSRTVDVKVHPAAFKEETEQHYFIKVVNTSPESDVEVSHISYEGSKEVQLVQQDNPLPRTIKPSTSWEWNIPLADIPDDDDVFSSFRVHLSTGEVFDSTRNDPPAEGFVARGDGTAVTGTTQETQTREASDVDDPT